jgi:hypothetical protein
VVPHANFVRLRSVSVRASALHLSREPLHACRIFLQPATEGFPCGHCILLVWPRVGRIICTNHLIFPVFFPSSHFDLSVFLNLSSLFLVLRITFLRLFSTVLSQVISPLLHMFYIFPLLCHVFFSNIVYMCVICIGSSCFNL